MRKFLLLESYPLVPFQMRIQAKISGEEQPFLFFLVTDIKPLQIFNFYGILDFILEAVGVGKHCSSSTFSSLLSLLPQREEYVSHISCPAPSYNPFTIFIYNLPPMTSSNQRNNFIAIFPVQV